MSSLPSSSGSKRAGQDDLSQVPDPKRPKAIKNPLKVKCLTLIIKSYEGILEHITKLVSGDESKTTPVKDKQALLMDITLANNITNMIYSSHTLRLQSKENTEQLGTENTRTDFKVTLSGNQIVVKQDCVMKIWDAAVKSVGLSYTDPKTEDKLWFGTINIFIHFFLGFSLRKRELQRGLQEVVIKETDKEVTVVPIARYGLSGDYDYALLEGVSFPPNIRRIMIEWLGPMTAFLCMLCSCSDLRLRKKYEDMVRKTMRHIPCIDEIIDITRKARKPSLSDRLDIMMITNLIAEILLRNPVAEKTALFFPLNFLVVAATEHNTQGRLDTFLDFFSLTGSGGFYTYKTLVELQETHKFTMRSGMNEEMVSQVAFHCIFGTFKEDFGVLSSITPNKNWLTRKDIGTCLNARGSLCTDVEIKLIPFKVYAKASPTETPVLLVTPHREYVRGYTIPCFSGMRIQCFYTPGFNNIEPKVTQIGNILNDTLTKLKEYLRNNQSIVRVCWRDWESLALGTHGDEKPDFPVDKNGMTFVGKKTGL